jgi:outer membrane lipoprotein-sorting protein
MKKILLTTVIIFLALPVFADQYGEDIARRSFDLPESDDDYSVTTMILINEQGDRKIRKIEFYSQEGNEGRNTFMEFMEPADVSGTCFLTLGKREGDDEQRIYLPALGRVRRISSSENDGKFMGSDIYYYDLEDNEWEDFTYQYLRDDTYNGMDCYVVESYPEDEDAPYSKVVLWINKDNYFVYKRECYDREARPRLIKTIVVVETETVDGIIIFTKMAVDNHEDSHQTLLLRENVQVNIGVPDDIFTVRNLEN